MAEMALTKKERAVYDCLCKYGANWSKQAIADKTKTHITHVFRVLKILEQKGLICRGHWGDITLQA